MKKGGGQGIAQIMGDEVDHDPGDHVKRRVLGRDQIEEPNQAFHEQGEENEPE